MTHQTGTDNLYTDRLRYIGIDEGWVRLNTEHARLAASNLQRNGANADLLDYLDPRALAWAEDHGADLLIAGADGNPLTDILRMLIRQTITKALKDAATRGELVDNLRNVYAFNLKAAQVIAQTEIRLAQGYGGLAGAIADGMKVKNWLLSNDEGVCPLCEANAQQGWIAIDLPYASGALAPLDHAGCRCDAVYRRAVP